jgi:hypothetical protein
MVATRTAGGSNVFRTACACDRGEGLCRRGEGGRVLDSSVFLGARWRRLVPLPTLRPDCRRHPQPQPASAWHHCICIVYSSHVSQWCGVRGWRGQGWVAEGQRAQRLLVGLSSVLSPKSLLQIPFLQDREGARAGVSLGAPLPACTQHSTIIHSVRVHFMGWLCGGRAQWLPSAGRHGQVQGPCSLPCTAQCASQ